MRNFWKNRGKVKRKDWKLFNNIVRRKKKYVRKRKKKRNRLKKKCRKRRSNNCSEKSEKNNLWDRRRNHKDRKEQSNTKQSLKVWPNILPYSKRYSKAIIVDMPRNKMKDVKRLWARDIQCFRLTLKTLKNTKENMNK